MSKLEIYYKKYLLLFYRLHKVKKGKLNFYIIKFLFDVNIWNL